MYTSDFDVSLLAKAIRARRVADIVSQIEKGTNINTDAGGIRIFEALFRSKRSHTVWLH